MEPPEPKGANEELKGRIETMRRLGIEQQRIAEGMQIDPGRFSRWLDDKAPALRLDEADRLEPYIKTLIGKLFLLLGPKNVTSGEEKPYDADTRPAASDSNSDAHGAPANGTFVESSPRSLDPAQLADAGQALIDIQNIAINALVDLGFTDPDRRKVPSPRPAKPKAPPSDGTVG